MGNLIRTKGGLKKMIFCVEDDENIRDIEVYALNSTGFEAVGFGCGAEFRQAVKKNLPELIILDIMLPGEDGTELLRYIKETPELSEIPVIMATARGQEYDKVRSLDLGADDYLVKPFGMMEMVSRVKAVLRRCKQSKAPKLLKTGGLVLNPDEHIVKIEGETVPLTFKEFEILRLFLSRPGVVFSRDMLFSEVWGMDFCGETRTVDMHIQTLRKKLGNYGDMIKTVRSVGYRLEAKK